MSVSKDWRGVWRFRIVVKRHDGTKVRISGTPEINTRAAAQSEERAAIERAKTPTAVTGPARAQAPAPTVADFSAEWQVKHCIGQGNRLSTRNEKEGHLRLYILPALGHLRLDQVTGAAIADLKAHLAARLSLKTVHNVLQNLRKMLRSAVAWGKLAAVPEFPAIKVPRSSFNFYTETEALTLTSCGCRPLDRLALRFALDTGARISEQLAIEWQDIDWQNRRIWIKRQRYHGVVGPTKTGTERYVDMTDALFAALQIRFQEASAEAPISPIESPRAAVGLIFHGPNGEPLKQTHFDSALKRSCATAGVRLLNWHALRHTFASHLVMRGVPIRFVQRWLGHASIVTTERYAHLAEGSGAGYIKALEQRGHPPTLK